MTIKPGFDPAEAEFLLEIAQQTYIDTPGLGPPSDTCGLLPVPKPFHYPQVRPQ